MDLVSLSFEISFSTAAAVSQTSILVSGLKPAPHEGDPLVKPVTFTSTRPPDSPFPSISESQPLPSTYYTALISPLLPALAFQVARFTNIPPNTASNTTWVPNLSKNEPRVSELKSFRAVASLIRFRTPFLKHGKLSASTEVLYAEQVASALL